MTRVYRDLVNAITWVERGDGSPLVAVPDHGDPAFVWRVPDVSTLVYDDHHHAVENDLLTDVRDRLLTAVGSSKIPPTSKADVRAIVADVFGGGAGSARAG